MNENPDIADDLQPWSLGELSTDSIWQTQILGDLERIRGLSPVRSTPNDQRMIAWVNQLFTGTQALLNASTVVGTPGLERCEKFVLLNLVGQGTFGTVHRALDTQTRKLVALKRLRLTGAEADEGLARFKEEARALQQLNHPNVVRCLEAGMFGRVPYLSLELLDGDTLRNKVEFDGPLSIPLVCQIIREAAAGLHHIHEQGLIHRDIKPGNIMMDESGSVKVLDFGLVRSFDAEREQLTATGTTLGTYDYMSPEQARRPQGVDRRADIYSLGATMYYLLSGSVPYDDALTGHAKLIAVADPMTHPRPLREHRRDIPPALVNIVDKMMHKELSQRYQTAEEVRQALQRFEQTVQLGVADTVVESPVAAQPKRRQSGRHAIAIGLTLAASIAITAGVIIVIQNKKGEKVAELNIPDKSLNGGKVIIKDEKSRSKVTVPIPGKKPKLPRTDGELRVGDEVEVVIQTTGYDNPQGNEGLESFNAVIGWKGKVLDIPEEGDLCKVAFEELKNKPVWLRQDCLKVR